MNLSKFKFSIFLILSILITSCSSEDENSITKELNLKPVAYSELENGVLDQINSYRNSIGNSTLKKLDIVSYVATTHTNYMVETGNVDHSGFEERQQDLMENAGAKSVGENVAYGYSTSEEVVNAWLKSDSHRALIENKNFTHFGISTETNSLGREYYTLMFIKK
jgi:uncharacterized protein YkwD